MNHQSSDAMIPPNPILEDQGDSTETALTSRDLTRRSDQQLAEIRPKLERRVRDRALAGIHDALPNIIKHARDGGARDAPAAMRELRAIALPEATPLPAPASAGADVARILEALPRLMSALPGGRAAAPALLGAVEADYELLEPTRPAPTDGTLARQSAP